MHLNQHLHTFAVFNRFGNGLCRYLAPFCIVHACSLTDCKITKKCSFEQGFEYILNRL